MMLVMRRVGLSVRSSRRGSSAGVPGQKWTLGSSSRSSRPVAATSVLVVSLNSGKGQRPVGVAATGLIASKSLALAQQLGVVRNSLSTALGVIGVM